MRSKDDLVERVESSLGAAGVHNSEHMSRSEAERHIVHDELDLGGETVRRDSGCWRHGGRASDETRAEKEEDKSGSNYCQY